MAEDVFDEFDFDDLDEDLDNIIELNDEQGNPVEFEFLDVVEYQNEEYIVLAPVEDFDGEVVILHVDDDGDSELEEYSGVEDQETLNAVFGIFKERFKDEFDFED